MLAALNLFVLGCISFGGISTLNSFNVMTLALSVELSLSNSLLNFPNCKEFRYIRDSMWFYIEMKSVTVRNIAKYLLHFKVSCLSGSILRLEVRSTLCGRTVVLPAHISIGL